MVAQTVHAVMPTGIYLLDSKKSTESATFTLVSKKYPSTDTNGIQEKVNKAQEDGTLPNGAIALILLD